MGKWSNLLEPVNDYTWRLPQFYKNGMRVDGIIFANQRLMEVLENEEAIEQVANVAYLPGIVGHSFAMPDIHWGYGFPVGGVAATGYDEGVISPGGIGFDINCGVRLLKTNLFEEELKGKVENLIRTLFSEIPCGVGKGGNLKLSSQRDMERVLKEGSRWAIKEGFGTKEDLMHTESFGSLEDANPDTVSKKARERGEDQMGTLGSGNHFLEIQVVREIFDEESAKAFGLEKGMITIMIHTGSRGLGHQVATDYLNKMGKAMNKYGISLPDRQLACAPLKSEEGQEYFQAMSASANFAWANRQVITHGIRKAFEKIFKKSWNHLGLELVYDVAHNIAKIEEHPVEGKNMKLCVHRKGATRSLGAGSPEIPKDHREVGQAVIIPGDMGRYSYVLAGNKESQQLSFSSTCHGAGRLLSRTQAKKAMKGRDLEEELAKRGIFVKGISRSGLDEEAPDAYKDVADVVDTAHGAGLARRVAKLKPLGVMKG